MNLTENGTAIPGLTCMPDRIEAHKKIILLSLNIPLSITAFLGNALIILALQKPSSLHPPSKLLFGCLAITDLCVGLFTQPVFVVYLMSPHLLKRCVFVQFLLIGVGSVFCGVSLLTLTAISVDRLLALILGVRYKQIVTLRRVWVFIVTSWLSAAASAVPYFYKFGMLARSIATTVVILCIATSTFCYSKIYLKLRRYQAALLAQHMPQGQPNGGGIPLNMARYKKTVLTAFLVQITLLACYLPTIITTTVADIRGSFTPSLAFGSTVAFSIVFLNSSLNPFLYCWKMREVRQAVKNKIRHVWCF